MSFSRWTFSGATFFAFFVRKTSQTFISKLFPHKFRNFIQKREMSIVYKNKCTCKFHVFTMKIDAESRVFRWKSHTKLAQAVHPFVLLEGVGRMEKGLDFLWKWKFIVWHFSLFCKYSRIRLSVDGVSQPFSSENRLKCSF